MTDATPAERADAKTVAARVRAATDGYRAMRAPEQRAAFRKAVALGCGASVAEVTSPKEALTTRG